MSHKLLNILFMHYRIAEYKFRIIISFKIYLNAQ